MGSVWPNIQFGVSGLISTPKCKTRVADIHNRVTIYIVERAGCARGVMFILLFLYKYTIEELSCDQPHTEWSIYALAETFH